MSFERQIEAFRAVMLTGGMTTAANTMHITQPAVSRLIRDLEYELKLNLFHRRGNQVSPTAEAFDLFAEVERTFLGFDRLKSRAEELRTGRSGALRIAALPAMAISFLPRFIASFCRERPELKVLIDGIPSHLVLERVAGGQFDIGVSALTVERASLHITPIDDAAVAVIPSNHRLASKQVIRAPDLRDETLIMLAPGFYHRSAIEAVLASIPRRQMIETPLSSIACVLASEGMGITIVDPFSASEFVGRGVVLRPFEPRMSVGCALVRSSDRPLSHIATEFYAALQAHIEEFLRLKTYLARD